MNGFILTIKWDVMDVRCCRLTRCRQRPSDSSEDITPAQLRGGLSKVSRLSGEPSNILVINQNVEQKVLR
jgi:hypothetical protein